MAGEGGRAPIDWAAVRRDYESGEGTIPIIAERHGTKPSTLSQRVRDEEWQRRYRRRQFDRTDIILRMFKVLDRQVAQLEKDMEKSGDKEVALLGNMARTLEKLIDLDTAERPEKAKKTQARDMAALRTTLAERIDRLKRG